MAEPWDAELDLTEIDDDRGVLLSDEGCACRVEILDGNGRLLAWVDAMRAVYAVDAKLLVADGVTALAVADERPVV